MEGDNLVFPPGKVVGPEDEDNVLEQILQDPELQEQWAKDMATIAGLERLGPDALATRIKSSKEER